MPADKTNIRLHTGVIVDIPNSVVRMQSDGVLFKIFIRTDGRIEELFSRFVSPRGDDQTFESVEVDLSAYSGKEIELGFETEVGITDDATDYYDWAMWLNPELTYK